MKTVIFGLGFIGRRLARDVPGAELVECDIADAKAVERALDEHSPAAVVNAAGKTGKPNVDWCETHQYETLRSNVVGPLTLAQACEKRNTYLLHLASGCIFYGDSPDPKGWREDDFANPVSFYSKSKYSADLVLGPLPNVGIARLRMPIDDQPGSRNLITKLSNYPKVVDVENSVTIVEDLVNVVAELVSRRAAGVYHVTNPGTMRHRDLLALYKEIVDPDHSYQLIESEELVALGLADKARSNCILQDNRLAALGVKMRPIELALRATMEAYARNAKAEAASSS